MADIFVTELGDMLATNNLSDELGIQTLPSPKDLKRKILLKGKIKVKKKVLPILTIISIRNNKIYLLMLTIRNRLLFFNTENNFYLTTLSLIRHRYPVSMYILQHCSQHCSQ